MLKCVWNLSKHDLKLYKILLGKKMRADELAKIVGKDRSTVQRSLKRLLECMMIEREKRLLEDGGYYYIYRGLPVNEIKERLRICIDRWYEEMREMVEKLDEFI